MLPQQHRLTESTGFTSATRGGLRAGGRLLVVHLGRDTGQDVPARVGFVVSRAVGNAVVRNRVRRRLRHLMRDRVGVLPQGAVLAVRALPASAQAESVELARELDRCLSRVGVEMASAAPKDPESVKA